MAAHSKAIARLGGVRQTLGQGERLLDSSKGLIWVAERQQGSGCNAKATYSRVIEGADAPLVRIVEGNCSLQMCSGPRELSKISQDHSHQKVGLVEELLGS